MIVVLILSWMCSFLLGATVLFILYNIARKDMAQSKAIGLFGLMLIEIIVFVVCIAALVSA